MGTTWPRTTTVLPRLPSAPRVRIAFLSERGQTTPPRTHGGSERAVDMLARGLRARGHDVTVWAKEGSASPDYRVRHYLPDSGQLAPQDVEELADHDVIHAHGMESNRTGFRNVEQWLRLKGRLVQTYHGNFPYYIRPYSMWLRAAPWKARPHFVTQNSQQVEYARRHGIPNVTRIPNPAPHLPFVAHAEDFFLYMGRVIPGKGVRLAIRVAKEAGVRLVIAGAPDPEFAKDHILPHVSPKIEYLGEVDEVTRNRLLRTATALVFPSRFPEGMPLTVLEANVCGTPVISSASYGAASDLVEEGVNGFVCDSVDAMVRAARRVTSIDRRECAESVRRRFSIETVTAQYLALYRDVFGAADADPSHEDAPQVAPPVPA